jgi:ECF transporter S component (folate family)
MGSCPRTKGLPAVPYRIRCHKGLTSYCGDTEGGYQMKSKKLTTRTLVIMATLIAMTIVLSRFLSFSVWNMKIGLAFIPIAITAMIFGPIEAGIVAALSDFLGAILFPIGPYFPGFTLTAFLVGIIFGLFLHKDQRWLNVLGAVLVHQIACSQFLNTLWISILYSSPYWPLFVTRLVQTAIMSVVEFIVIELIVKVFARFGKKALA